MNKKTLIIMLAIVYILVLALAACNSNTINEIGPQQASEPTAAVPQTQTLVPQISESASPTGTPGPTPTPDPTATPEPSATPISTVTPTPTVTPDPTVTPEPTTSPDSSTTPEPTTSPDPPATPEPSATPEPTTTPDPEDEIEEDDRIPEVVDRKIDYLIIPEQITIKDYSELLPYLTEGQYMPNLIGLGKDEAVEILNSLGFTNYVIDYEYSEYYQFGYVFQQTLPPLVNIEEIDKETKFTVRLSKGPDRVFHNELVDLCEEKDWPKELWPYIVASAKKIIETVYKDGEEVIYRLRNNINEIKLLSNVESASIEYKGSYNTDTKNIKVSSLTFDESTMIHELIHAISNDTKTKKIGLSTGLPTYVEANEAYTDYLADLTFNYLNYPFYHLMTSDASILITSDVHFCNGPYNVYLHLNSPLFQLIGKEKLEEAFFGTYKEYNDIVKEFDEFYGEGTWHSLFSKAEEVCRVEKSEGYEAALERVDLITEYYDSIFSCLEYEKDLFLEGELTAETVVQRIEKIKGSFPLSYNDYREKFRDLYNEISSNSMFYNYLREGVWEFEYEYEAPINSIISILANQGDASHISLYLYVNLMFNPELYVTNWLRRYDEYNIGSDLYPGPPKITYNTGESYRIYTRISEYYIENYYVVEDIVSIFEGSKINFEDPESSLVIEYFEMMGIEVQIEYLDVPGISDSMNGMLVGQYPEQPVALLYDEATITLTFLRRID